MALGVSGNTSGIKSNQATLNAVVTGADVGRPVGLGFYNASDDSLLNTVTELTGLSGKVHLATKDGEAMVFVDDVDLADYAGSDSGNTPNMMIMEDSSGNICASFCGAAGGGESLGAEIIDGWSNHPTLSFETFVTTGASITDAQNTAASGFAKKDYSTLGEILKCVNNFNLVSGVNPVFGLGAGSAIQAYNMFTRNGISYKTGFQSNAVSIFAGSLCSFTMTSVSVKPLTDVPATGLHLIDQPDGSTRNIAYKDTSFNPNDVVTIKIFNRFTLGNYSDTFDWTGLSPATAYSWYPKADNGVQIVTGDTVNFDTNTKPYASSISPADGETVTETDVTLSATFNDDEGGAGSLRFYNAEDVSLIDTAAGVTDGATGQVTWSGLTPGKEYQFYVVPNDGTEDGAASATITFKVAALGRGFSPFYSPFGSPFNSPFQNM